MGLRWRNIWSVFMKETRDTLRDRRTLFAAIILPIIINPLLFIGLFMLMTTQTAEQQRQEFSMVIVGAEHAPRLSRIFENFEPPETLGMRFDVPEPDAPVQELKPEEERHINVRLYPSPALFEHAETDADGYVTWDAFWAYMQALHEEVGPNSPNSPKPPEESHYRTLFAAFDHDDTGRIAPPPLEELHGEVEDGQTQVLLVFPQGFEQRLGREMRQSPQVHYLGSSDRSATAQQLVSELIRRYVEPLTPVRLVSVDVHAGSMEIRMISRFIPYLIILMVLTAAFTPAIDLMAGEKERGTIETLLISPADRRELILGKFSCVTSVAVAATALNITSLAITIFVIGNMWSQMMAIEPPPEMAQHEMHAPLEPGEAPLQTQPDNGTDNSEPGEQAVALEGEPPPTSLEGLERQEPRGLFDVPPIFYPIIFLLMVPAAALFGAIALAISAFAKSYKEGQYYITPMMMVAIPLAMISLLPGIEFNWRWGLVPISNFSLLFRDLLTEISTLGTVSPQMWGYVAQVVVVTGVYAYLGLRWATSNFYREDILFRVAEEFNWKVWEVPGPKRTTPSSAGAGFAFVVALILFFFLGQTWMIEAAGYLAESFDEALRRFALAHVMNQVLLIAGPAILLTLINRYKFGNIFWTGPGWGFGWVVRMIGGLALGVAKFNPLMIVRALPIRQWPIVLGVLLVTPALSVLMIWLLSMLTTVFGMPAHGPMEQMGEHILTWGLKGMLLLVLFMAVVPGIFEEILFRGFILTGMLPDEHKNGKARRADGTLPTPWKAIIITGILFGLMHLSAIRIPITFIGGVLLGWIAWRTRSLWWAVAVHILYNAMPVIYGLAADRGVEAIRADMTVPSWVLAAAVVSFVVGLVLIHKGTAHLQTMLPGERRPTWAPPAEQDTTKQEPGTYAPPPSPQAET